MIVINYLENLVKNAKNINCLCLTNLVLSDVIKQ